MGGIVNGPSNNPLEIHLYAASVKCKPSQLTYEEGSSQAFDERKPHLTDELKLYGPPPPQQAVRVAPVNPTIE